MKTRKKVRNTLYKKNIFIFTFFLSSFTLKAQVIEDLGVFKVFGDTMKVGKEYKFSDGKNGVSQRIIFIGEVTDKKNITYRIFISFLNFLGKGVNDLIFISKQNQYKYRLNLPSDAPFKISFNELYFKNKDVIKTMKLNSSFNEWFCTPFECFEKIR